MFTLIKVLLGLVGVVVVAAIIFYFLPASLKTKTLTFVSGVVPDAIEAKAKELLLTPSQERDSLIKKVEQNLSALKTSAQPQAQELVQQTETLLQELKDKNGERSLAEIVKEKLVDQLLSKGNQQNCILSPTAPTP